MTIGRFEIRYKKDSFGYQITIWDGNIGVAEFTLAPKAFDNINGYQVEWAGLNSKYQGQGIGYALYKALITLWNITLIQSDSHSIGAAKTWLRLSQEPSIASYGFDVKFRKVFLVKPNGSKTSLVPISKKEELYTNENAALMLTKRNGSNDRKMAEKMKNNPRNRSKPDVFGNKKFEPIET